ncbi:hypothetical protein LCGC14_1406780 [marine sediment metagenome]|uniref:Uncharacterized protein n=1 Tax=marine sediment metagenome TaxID=412755 RepID=A0A0F9MX32_9ZZZZ|nr:hypothetical protein [archaeon]
MQALNINLDVSVNINSYITRLEKTTLQTIVIGIIITGLLIVSNLVLPISIYRLSVMLSIECLYILYIIISSQSEIFEISTEFTYLKVDLSMLNLFLLPVSIIYMIRTVVKYIFERRGLICNLQILDEIHMKNNSSKIKIRKYILKDEIIDQSIRDYLLKNFNEIIRGLESSRLILKKSSNYTVTKNGIDLLKRYGKMSFEELPNLDTLQVWTEKDLEKLTEERVKKNLKKNKNTIG